MKFYEIFTLPDKSALGDAADPLWMAYVLMTCVASVAIVVSMFMENVTIALTYLSISTVLFLAMCVYWYQYLKTDEQFLYYIGKHYTGPGLYDEYIFPMIISLCIIFLNWALYTPLFVIRFVLYIINNLRDKNRENNTLPIHIRLFRKIYKKELIENKISK